MGLHVYSIYKYSSQKLSSVVDFFSDGLLGKEACIFIGDEKQFQELLTRLSVNIKAADFEKNGQLSFIKKEDFYLTNGLLDVDNVLKHVNDIVESKGKLGFSKVRFSGEPPQLSEGELSKYESVVDEVLENKPNISAICHYHEPAFSESYLNNTLKVHDNLSIYGYTLNIDKKLIQDKGYRESVDIILEGLDK